MATEADKVNDGALATLVAVGTFSMIGICAFVTALVRSELSSETERKEEGAGQEVRSVRDAQRAKLAAPAAWADRGKGLVSLPIDRAKDLVLTDLAKDPNSATPPPPRPQDAGANPASHVPEAGAEGVDGGASAADASDGVQGSTVTEPAPGGPEKPAEKKVVALPPASAPAPPKPAPVAPAPAAPASATP